ncbi:MAG: dihydrolipoyl dehydrogenase family protein, partial [Bryobacteraceae bacterium]
FETPEELRKQGIDVILGLAHFLDDRTVAVGQDTIRAKAFVISTGARPALPEIEGLKDVPFVTNEQIFDNDRLPPRLIVIGGGPIGAEMAQAYQRLGSKVTVIARNLLPKEDPEARTRIERVFEQEGVRISRGRANKARKEGADVVIGTDTAEVRGDLLMIASGRAPNVSGLNLEAAGVRYSEKGVSVDDQLRTNVKHIYAAGDVVGGYQFTHFAAWQAFQAARNALLPGHASGFSQVVPRVTFTDPEIAHVGVTESEARAKSIDGIRIHTWEMTHTDRAICENDSIGFIKVITKDDGIVLGATIMAARAGETITEFVLAIRHGLKIAQLAEAIHAYPTYSTAVQQLASDIAVENLLSGTSGRLLLGLSKIIR